LPEAFAKLDFKAGCGSKASVSQFTTKTGDVETASLSSADRKLVRSADLTDRIINAAQKGSRKNKVA
jgi:hypothetical protein